MSKNPKKASIGPTTVIPGKHIKKKVAVKVNPYIEAQKSKTSEEKKNCKKISKKAGECVYILETVLGNMKEIEDYGGKGTDDEIEKINQIYKEIKELNLRIINL